MGRGETLASCTEYLLCAGPLRHNSPAEQLLGRPFDKQAEVSVEIKSLVVLRIGWQEGVKRSWVGKSMESSEGEKHGGGSLERARGCLWAWWGRGHERGEVPGRER